MTFAVSTKSMAATAGVKQPFVTVFRPCSRAIGEPDHLSNFEKLFEKWRRRQDYQRRIEKKREGSPSKRKQSNENEEDSRQPFDFQNPPKVLHVKAIPLVPRSSPHKTNFPSIHLKQTVASMARRYVNLNFPAFSHFCLHSQNSVSIFRRLRFVYQFRETQTKKNGRI